MLTLDLMRVLITMLLPCMLGTGCSAQHATAATALKVVLVAGDDSAAVFDNATARLARDLRDRAGVAAANLHRLSASDREIEHGADPATRRGVVTAIAGLNARDGETCLVYVTSHGMPHRGLVLTASDDTLPPGQLDVAVDRGCGDAPTVLVLSGCFSGIYTARPVARGNRIVISAARPDRTSFGCGADFTYTYIDECFLDAIEGAPRNATWHDAFARATQCVAQRERAMHITPSEPQAAFGRAVADLQLPWTTRR